MLMRSAYCLTPLSLGMTRKAVVLHSNDIENTYNIHWKCLGCYVKTSEGFLQSKITYIGRF